MTLRSPKNTAISCDKDPKQCKFGSGKEKKIINVKVNTEVLGPCTNSIYIAIIHIFHSNTAFPFLGAEHYVCWCKYCMNWNEDRPMPSFKMGHLVKQRYAASHHKVPVYLSPAFTNHTHRNSDTVAPDSTASITMSPLAKISCCIPSQKTGPVKAAGRLQEGEAELSAPLNFGMAQWLPSARFRPVCGHTNCTLPRDPWTVCTQKVLGFKRCDLKQIVQSN